MTTGGTAPSRASLTAAPWRSCGSAALRYLKGGDCAVVVGPRLAQFAERKPGGGIARRQFQRLRQEIGRAGEIALRLQIARPFVAAVGRQIA